MKVNLLVGFIFLSIKPYAQYAVNINIQEPIDSVVYLRTTLFDDKNFIPKDTLKLLNGIGSFRSNQSIVGGIYYLYFPVRKQKIFIVLEKGYNISLKCKGNDILTTIKSNSTIQDSYFNYQRLEYAYSYLDSQFSKLIKEGYKFNMVQKAGFFKVKTDTLMIYRNNLLKYMKPSHPLYIHFNALNQLDGSVPNKKDFSARDMFLKKISFTEPKLLFTQNLKFLLQEYLSYYPLHGDSLFTGMENVFSRISCNVKSYPYVLDYFISVINNRNIQSNTNGYLRLLEKYAVRKDCSSINELKAKQFKEQLNALKEQMQMKVSDDIMLNDTIGNPQSLLSFANAFDYTVIMFYSPSCEHCQVEIPSMDSMINILEERLGLSIGKYAVNVESAAPVSSWKEFIKSYKLIKNYQHLMMPDNSPYRQRFGVYATPLFYLINKEGVILDRKISSSTIQKYFIPKAP